MVWDYFVRKHSQQISIGYNARLAVIMLRGPRMDLLSDGYPKRSPGVSNGSLFYALAPYGCKPLFRALATSSTVLRAHGKCSQSVPLSGELSTETRESIISGVSLLLCSRTKALRYVNPRLVLQRILRRLSKPWSSHRPDDE